MSKSKSSGLLSRIFVNFKPFELYERGNYSIANIFFHYEIHKESVVVNCQSFAIAALLCVALFSEGEPSLFFVGAVSSLGGLILTAHLMFFHAQDWRNFIMDNFINEIAIMAFSLVVILSFVPLPGCSFVVALGSAIYCTALTVFVAGFFGEGSPNVYMIEA